MSLNLYASFRQLQSLQMHAST